MEAKKPTWEEQQLRIKELEKSNHDLQHQVEVLTSSRRVVRVAPLGGVRRDRVEAALGKDTALRSTLYDIAIPEGTRYLLVTRDNPDIDEHSAQMLRRWLRDTTVILNVPEGAEVTVLELPPAR